MGSGPRKVDPSQVEVDVDLHNAVEKEAATHQRTRRQNLRNPEEHRQSGSKYIEHNEMPTIKQRPQKKGMHKKCGKDYSSKGMWAMKKTNKEFGQEKNIEKTGRWTRKVSEHESKVDKSRN